ncbi:MAG: ribonuclease D [Alphaproteobacteria bacterium]|nr:ribonuclease D [Alphaproteobacteria bacterium]
MVEIRLHQGDLPGDVVFEESVAIDTEAMGLNYARDRLCLVQLAGTDGVGHVVQFRDNVFNAPNLVHLLLNPKVLKIFHFARFDMAIMKQYLGAMATNVYCTKIASRLARTYTDEHSLRVLCQELLHIKISKQEQSSDWGRADLSESQLHYAANDVLYLNQIRHVLDDMLKREKREHLLRGCLDFLPTRVELDLGGWNSPAKIFDH